MKLDGDLINTDMQRPVGTAALKDNNSYYWYIYEENVARIAVLKYAHWVMPE